jgi:uncharacterized paraquat-inducible protein A
MSTKQLVLLGLGMIVVAVGLMIYTSTMTQDRIGTNRPVEEGKCPDCGKEISSRMGGECPYCKMTQAREGKPKSGPAQRFTRTHAVLLALIVFLLFGGGYLLIRSGTFKFRRRKPSEPTYHTRCPHCKRRIRYFASQVGRQVLCPTCRWALTAPVPKA